MNHLTAVFVLTIAATSVAVPARAQPKQDAQTPVVVAVDSTRRDSAAAQPMQAHGPLRGVLAAREQGPEALRRYIFRTRSIYHYDYQAYAKPEWAQR